MKARFERRLEENQQVLDILKKANMHQDKQLALQKLREENKILLKNLNSIQDPQLRVFIKAEQKRILNKRAQQQ